jgi:hypothetical protein
MAIQHVELVLHRLTRDEAFRAQYCKDPDGTLARYLTPAEIRVLKSGDHQATANSEEWGRLQELSAALCGSDPRS